MEKKKRQLRPALSPEARNNQIISLVTDLAEEQARNKTMTSQVMTHYLKLATEKTKLELAILESQKELIEAKTQAIRDDKQNEIFYSEVIDAMKKYSGVSTDD